MYCRLLITLIHLKDYGHVHASIVPYCVELPFKNDSVKCRYRILMMVLYDSRLLSRADDLEALMNEEVTDINELLSVINNIQVNN